MAYDADYTQLLDEAEEAILALLRESREECFLDLRAGLAEIGQERRPEEQRDAARERTKILEEAREQLADIRRSLERKPPAETEAKRWRSEFEERRRAWAEIPAARREGLVSSARCRWRRGHALRGHEEHERATRCGRPPGRL